MRPALLAASLAALTACFDFDKKLSELCDTRFTCPIDAGGSAETTHPQPFTTGAVTSGWQWENPLPHALDLNVVFGTGPRDVWVGGQSRLLMHWDGGTWTTVAFGGSSMNPVESVTGLWASAPGDLWVAAAGLEVHHQSGPGFEPDDMSRQPPDTTFVALSGHRGDVMAGGDGVVLLHSSQGWGALTSAPGQYYFSVAGTDTDCWALSGSLEDLGGHMVTRCDGNGAEVHDVDGGAAVWLSGGVPYVAARDGYSWREGGVWRWRPLSYQPYAGAAVPGIDGGSMMAGSDGTVSFVGSSATTVVLAPYPSRPLRAVWSSGVNDIWVAGAGGALAHEDGTGFTSLQGGYPMESLYGMSVSSTRTVAVGNPDQVLERTSDGGWFRHPGTDALGFLRAVFELTDGTLVAASEGSGLRQRQGQNWVLMPGAPTTSVRFNGIWGRGPDDVWATGNGAWHRSASGWREVVTADAGISLWKVAGQSNGAAVWTVGSDVDGGFAMQLLADGGTNLERVGEVSVFFGVAVAESGEVWAVGATNAIFLRHADAGWEDLSITAGYSDLFDVHVVSADEVYAAGNEGTVLRGGTTIPFTQLRTNLGPVRIEAVRKVGGDVMVVGERGLILRKLP